MFTWWCEKCLKGHVLSARKTSEAGYKEGKAYCPECSGKQLAKTGYVHENAHNLILTGRVILDDSPYIELDKELAESFGLQKPTDEQMLLADR